MNKQILHDMLILLAITLCAGLLLGGVYQVTKGPIAHAAEQKKTDAYQAVFADAANFVPIEETSVDGEVMAGEAFAWEADGKISVDEVLYAEDANGQILGAVMTITTHEGYGGALSFTMGVRSDGTVNGISILEINETMGLGMEAKKEEFYGQFAGRQVSAFSYTKSGATEENQIDAISGATITTNAVTNAVNAGLEYAYRLLKIGEGGQADA